MTDHTTTRAEIVTETLRYLAGSGQVCREDGEWIAEVADEIQHVKPHDMSCPLCQETTCDEGCPLAPVRHPGVGE